MYKVYDLLAILNHSIWYMDLCIGLYELMDMFCGAVHRQVRCEMHRVF